MKNKFDIHISVLNFTVCYGIHIENAPSPQFHFSVEVFYFMELSIKAPNMFTLMVECYVL